MCLISAAVFGTIIAKQFQTASQRYEFLTEFVICLRLDISCGCDMPLRGKHGIHIISNASAVSVYRIARRAIYRIASERDISTRRTASQRYKSLTGFSIYPGGFDMRFAPDMPLRGKHGIHPISNASAVSVYRIARRAIYRIAPERDISTN